MGVGLHRLIEQNIRFWFWSLQCPARIKVACGAECLRCLARRCRIHLHSVSLVEEDMGQRVVHLDRSVCMSDMRPWSGHLVCVDGVAARGRRRRPPPALRVEGTRGVEGGVRDVPQHVPLGGRCASDDRPFDLHPQTCPSCCCMDVRASRPILELDTPPPNKLGAWQHASGASAATERRLRVVHAGCGRPLGGHQGPCTATSRQRPQRMSRPSPDNDGATLGTVRCQASRGSPTYHRKAPLAAA